LRYTIFVLILSGCGTFTFSHAPVDVCYGDELGEVGVAFLESAIEDINEQVGCVVLAVPNTGHCDIDVRVWDKCNGGNAVRFPFVDAYIHVPASECVLAESLRFEISEHELLHLLGLNHDSDPHSLMYPKLYGIIQHIQQDDIDWLRETYCNA
jgi:hypothetical protein